MITKDKQKIKSYIWIDHCSEGFTHTEPGMDEEFLGRIMDLGDHGEMFIEVRSKSDGATLRTVNPRDVAEVIFEV